MGHSAITFLALLLAAVQPGLGAQQALPNTREGWLDRYYAASSAPKREEILMEASRAGDAAATSFLVACATRPGQDARITAALKALSQCPGFPFVSFLEEQFAAAPAPAVKQVHATALSWAGPHRRAGQKTLTRLLERHGGDSLGELLLPAVTSFLRQGTIEDREALVDVLLRTFEDYPEGPLHEPLFNLAAEHGGAVSHAFALSALLNRDTALSLRSARIFRNDRVGGWEDLVVSLFLDDSEGFLEARLHELLKGPAGMVLAMRLVEQADLMDDRQLELTVRLVPSSTVKLMKSFLLSSLKEPEPRRQILCLWLVRQLGTPSTLPPVKAANADVALLLADTRALLSGESRAARTILRELAQPRMDMKWRALRRAQALRLNSPALKRWLKQQLNSGAPWQIQGELLRLAGRAGLPGTIAHCDRALTHKRWQVRLAALEALAFMGSRAALIRLAEHCNDPRQRLARVAQEALEEATGLNHGNRIAAWRRALARLGSQWKPDPVPRRPRKTSGDRRYGPHFYGLDLRSNRVIFVCDKSGSMAGSKMDSLKQQLNLAIQGLDSRHGAFNVIFFSSTAQPWWNHLVRATRGNRAEAQKRLSRIQPDGSTNLYAALSRAFSSTQADTLVVLTDGAPSSGRIQGTRELLEKVKEWNRWRNLQIHAVYLDNSGRGADMAGASGAARFMRLMAEVGHGSFLAVSP